MNRNVHKGFKTFTVDFGVRFNVNKLTKVEMDSLMEGRGK